MESEFELTQLWETDMIVQFPKISAIYYGLLQAGYDFYIPERSAEHIRHLMKYRNRKHQDTVILYFGIHFIWSHGKRHYSSDENNSPSMLRTSSIGIFVPSCIVIRRSKSSTFLTAPTADTYLPPAFRSSGWK